MKKNVGDTFFLLGSGCFAGGVECVIMEVSEDDGRVLKAKAVYPDVRLLKAGFLIEGENYIIQEWKWSNN